MIPMGMKGYHWLTDDAKTDFLKMFSMSRLTLTLTPSMNSVPTSEEQLIPAIST